MHYLRGGIGGGSQRAWAALGANDDIALKRDAQARGRKGVPGRQQGCRARGVGLKNLALRWWDCWDRWDWWDQ